MERYKKKGRDRLKQYKNKTKGKGVFFGDLKIKNTFVNIHDVISSFECVLFVVITVISLILFLE